MTAYFKKAGTWNVNSVEDPILIAMARMTPSQEEITKEEFDRLNKPRPRLGDALKKPVVLKQTKYRLYAGAESCVDIRYDIMSICRAWFEMSENNPFMRQILTAQQIVQAITAKPSGVLLVGTYDDNFWPGTETPLASSIRRNPRGYSIFWNEETLNVE